MKALQAIKADEQRCRQELAEFRSLLDSKLTLSERKDILPFFKTHKQLAALVGSFNARNCNCDLLATEFPLFGDCTCDLVSGDSRSHQFCFMEFEDALPTSVFVTRPPKNTPEWAPRLERGFSQILDWFWILEDQRRTGMHKTRFGTDILHFVGVLVLGRRQYLDNSQREKLVWRSEQVRVGARQVHCLTFDDLYEELAWKLGVV